MVTGNTSSPGKNQAALWHPSKVAVIADVHGILPSLKAVLMALQYDPPDEIIVAGDFLGGPQPCEVLSVLRENNCRFILGNGEVNLLKMRQGTAPDVWWTHRQFDLGRWIYEQLDESIFEFLGQQPDQCVVQPDGTSPFRVVHGAPWDVNKLVFPDKEPQVLDRALGMIPEDVLVFAHTHLPGIIKQRGKLAVNPGSVGNNLNGDLRASYAELRWDGEGWQPALHYVPYELDEVIFIFHQSGLLEAARPLARAFLESILTGENTALDYILFAFAQAQAVGKADAEVVPDDIWLGAEADFPWRFDF